MKKQNYLFIIAGVILMMSSIAIYGQEPAKAPAQPAARPAFAMPVRIISPEILPDNS